MEIYDLLMLYPGFIFGLVVNSARSAASIILQACDVRAATPHSRILVHHGRTWDIPIDILLDDKKLKRFVDSMREGIEKKYAIYMSRTGMGRDEIQALCFEDRDIFPDEAKKLGLIDNIWTDPLPITDKGIAWVK